MQPAEVHSIASAASSPPPSESSSSPDSSSSKQLLVTDFWITSRSPGERQTAKAGMKDTFGSDPFLSWKVRSVTAQWALGWCCLPSSVQCCNKIDLIWRRWKGILAQRLHRKREALSQEIPRQRERNKRGEVGVQAAGPRAPDGPASLLECVSSRSYLSDASSEGGMVSPCR